MTGSAYRLDWLTTNLAVGHAPMSYDALDRLHELGIGAILNLCAEFCDLHSIESNAGFEVYYLPIPDEEAPDPEELEKALDWLDECLYLGKRVLVHCRFGIGRTGTVVNAYLLRKGLGHKLAGKKLKGLRSQPANFDQWRFIRKYGKKEKKLTIREPSLESRNKVDLFPFLYDYEQLLSALDQRLDQNGKKILCGRDHAACCQHPVFLSFIETVSINHFVNSTLSREVRRKTIERAVSATALLREAEQRQGIVFSKEDLLGCSGEPQSLCPLSDSGKCLIFANRPVTCRLFDLSIKERLDIMASLPNTLERLSENIYFALTSRFPGETALVFFLGEVVSGRFIQTFFHHLPKKVEPT
ncbi:MAG: dual specificity protein phosphatase family protein [Pseudomonadota bacterium]